MPTKYILIQYKSEVIAWGACVLLFNLPVIQAAPASNNNSPYRLNVEPVNKPLIVDPASNDAANRSPQIYQLEYKYRSPGKPLKVKAELSEKQLSAELVAKKLSDKNLEAALAEQPYSNEIMLAANAVSLDPSLVHAVIYVESRYRHHAISAKGAVGLMQVLPDTAARYGLRDAVYLPKGNIKAGTLYLRDLMVMFDNRLDLVLAAYNAGEGAVKKYSRQIPPYPETRHYVKAVMAKYALNAGNQQWHSPSSKQSEAEQDSFVSAIPRNTKYLSGTDMVISNELFTLKQTK